MIQTANATVHLGNNLDILPTLPDNSVDSIVTDPPYELGFMGKKWDSTGIAYSTTLWGECLRVLKPGGHLLAFGGTRTWHRIAVAIEDSGFEVRDSIAWMYGSGFPKSLDVSKAIDKAAGAERDVLPQGSTKCPDFPKACSGHNETGKFSPTVHALPTAPSTPEAKTWEGWGTALKPAFEPVIVARKPLIGTVAENVLTHGTGALNIDGSRIQANAGENFARPVNFTGQHDGWTRPWQSTEQGQKKNAESRKQSAEKATSLGRWPANVILDEYTAELLDEQSGVSKSQGGNRKVDRSPFSTGEAEYEPVKAFGDTGGASRFFYVAKASKRDRNEGLEGLEATRVWDTSRKPENVGSNTPQNRSTEPRQNFHPTVKPTDLMRYLVKLVTPTGGTVLDPFTGSGSTGKAAILEGFKFIGCEMTEDYFPIIEGRLKHAEQTKLTAEKEKEGELF